MWDFWLGEVTSQILPWMPASVWTGLGKMDAGSLFLPLSMVVAAKQATSEDFKTSQLRAKNLSCTYSAFYSNGRPGSPLSVCVRE